MTSSVSDDERQGRSKGSLPEGDEPQLVKSAERTVRILEVLSASPAKLSLTDLQRTTGYPRSSLHALLRTLRDLKWIETEVGGARYGIGPQALLCGTAYLDRDPAVSFAYRVLEELRADVGHTVHYARRDGDSIIYLASRESLAEVRRIYRVGRKLPATATALGQALLAELTPDEVAEVLPAKFAQETDHSIVDRDQLDAELDRIRHRGWALEREQASLGICCVAAAVGYRIPATDAISCSMPLEVAEDEARLQHAIDSVVAHAQRLAGMLRREGIR